MTNTGPVASAVGALPEIRPPIGSSAKPAESQPGRLSQLFRAIAATRWRRIPWPIVVVVLWGMLRWNNFAPSVASPFGLTIIFCSFLILIFEFWKSGDISPKSFLLDQTLSVAATTITASLAVLIYWERQTFYAVDIIVFAVVLSDAIMSPFNSFRTALRNIQAGVNPGHPTDPDNG